MLLGGEEKTSEVYEILRATCGWQAVHMPDALVCVVEALHRQHHTKRATCHVHVEAQETLPSAPCCAYNGHHVSKVSYGLTVHHVHNRCTHPAAIIASIGLIRKSL